MDEDQRNEPHFMLRRDLLKLWKVAKNANWSETLGNVYIGIKHGVDVTVMACDGYTVIEKLWTLDEPTELAEIWLPWEYCRDVWQAANNNEPILVYSDKCVVLSVTTENGGIKAILPMPEQVELQLAKYPDVKPLMTPRENAKRVYVDASKLKNAFEQFQWWFHGTKYPPKVWLEIDELDGHVAIRTDDEVDVGITKAAVMPLRVPSADKEQEPKPDNQSSLVPEEYPHFSEELFNDAVEVVIEKGSASSSLLQRRLRIGYAQAARIIEHMEERGVISEADGSRPRSVLIKRAKG